MGVFEMNMPIRTDMSRLHTFREVMLQVARELHNAHAHRNAPLHLLEENAMGDTPDVTGRAAPFNVVFTHRRPARLVAEGRLDLKVAAPGSPGDRVECHNPCATS